MTADEVLAALIEYGLPEENRETARRLLNEFEQGIESEAYSYAYDDGYGEGYNDRDAEESWNE